MITRLYEYWSFGFVLTEVFAAAKQVAAYEHFSTLWLIKATISLGTHSFLRSSYSRSIVSSSNRDSRFARVNLKPEVVTDGLFEELARSISMYGKYSASSRAHRSSSASSAVRVDGVRLNAGERPREVFVH